MVKALEGPISKNGIGGLIYSDSIYSATRFPLKAGGVFEGFRVLNFFEKIKKNKIEKINNF